VAVVLVRPGLLTHYCNNCDLLLHALAVPAVTDGPGAVADGTAMAVAALVSVGLTGQQQSRLGRKLGQCAFAEVR